MEHSATAACGVAAIWPGLNCVDISTDSTREQIDTPTP
jgi:hypothetical protein